MGSMMAQAARDPLFWACMTVAAQDSIWAIGTPNAVDLCERCHFPEGWLEGRSDPPNASAMTGSDFDGIHCDFCHAQWDSFFQTTYDGTRESNDWSGYWDEAGNTGPGSGTASQLAADATYLEDQTLASAIQLFAGGNFFSSNLPVYSTYQEHASGQFFVSGGGEKRASFADDTARHAALYSRTHKSKYFCGVCHDVSNPVLANLGLSGLADQSGGVDLITEQYSASRYFHVERTFSEFLLSAYGRGTGAATNEDFQLQGAPSITWAAKCQDCHMRDVTGAGCDKNDAPQRPGESTEHPNSGLPLHDLTGGNAWISYILASLDPSGPVYDPVNAQLLGQGPSVLTLDLTAGESPTLNGAALLAGSDRAKQQLQLAATIKNLSYDFNTGTLSFRIQNNTGHKLISGFPEGRRMFFRKDDGCFSISKPSLAGIWSTK
jgi:cytochrome c553